MKVDCEELTGDYEIMTIKTSTFIVSGKVNRDVAPFTSKLIRLTTCRDRQRIDIVSMQSAARNFKINFPVCFLIGLLPAVVRMVLSIGL